VGLRSSRDPGHGGASSEPAIAVEGVEKRFGDVVAVDRVTLEVRRGELLSLLGPSGCGKTTLLRMIGGFETPTAGAIRLAGVDVSRVPPHRRNVNTVFQHYALFPHLDVFANVAFGPRARGLDAAAVERRVREVLAVVKLDGLAARRPRQLSGGQQQRVALARALVNEPAAVLLDEPLAALDPELRREMQGELQRIQRDAAVSFLLVTHDREEALALSDRVAVMHRGRIEQVASPEEVYARPATAFVARFVGEANLLPVAVQSLRDGVAAVRLASGALTEAAAGDPGAAAGSRGLLLVRPERMRLTAESPRDGTPAIAVTVREVAFQGATLRCTARDAAGAAILCHVPAAADPRAGAGDAARPQPGDARWATWDPAAARVLPVDPGADAGA
jgi:spermidine/putrescine transport system ATP-binding protein